MNAEQWNIQAQETLRLAHEIARTAHLAQPAPAVSAWRRFLADRLARLARHLDPRLPEFTA